MTPPPGLFASGNRSVRTVSIQVSGTYPSTLQTTLTETLKSPGHQSNPSSRQRDRALVTFQNAANVFSARDPNVALLSMKYSSVLQRAGRSCGRAALEAQCRRPARRERPRGSHTADQRDELAAHPTRNAAL